jgi:uncharacterized membrane protein
MANVITCPPERLEHMMAGEEKPAQASPGYPPFFEFATSSTVATRSNPATEPLVHRQALIHAATTRTVTILAHLTLVAGLVWIGFRHFGNIQTGVATATLYLLTFYTSQFTSQMDHVVPGMLLVWAIAAYRRPTLSGLLIGLAGGLIYYPLFLLPLWLGFYWRRGLLRFVVGFALALGLLVGALYLWSPDSAAALAQVKQMFGWRDPFHVDATGFWQYIDSAFRIPVLAAFVALCLALAIWPAQKNLGTLLSCSAAVMLGVQFWDANHGGLYMAWYLPLLVLTIFRPNLEDRVALSAVKPLWRRKG